MSLFSTVLAVTSTGTAISPLAAVMMFRRIRRTSVLTTVAASVTGLAGGGVLAGVVVPDLAQSPALTTTVGLLLAAAVVIGAVWLLQLATKFLPRPRPVPAVVYAPASSTAPDEYDTGVHGQGRSWRDGGQPR